MNTTVCRSTIIIHHSLKTGGYSWFYKFLEVDNVSSKLKGTRILFQFLFLMEKSILYAKITVSPKTFFLKLSFKYYIGLLFS